MGHLHAAGEQARHKAGDEIARASDGLQSGNLRFGYVAEEPPAFHKVIDLPFDEQEARGVSVLIGAFDEAWDILIRGQQKTSGVKRVRRLFIGKEGQFPGIGGEQIVGVGVAAHLGDIHETGIGDEHGLRVRFFQSHQDAVVPIKVGEQVMKRDAPNPGQAGGGRKAAVELPAPVAVPGVPGEQCRGRLHPKRFARQQCGSEQGGCPALYGKRGDAPALRMEEAAIQTPAPPRQGKRRIRHGTADHPRHSRLASSNARCSE